MPGGVHLTSTYMHSSRCISMCSAHLRWQYWGGPSAFGISMFSICSGISLYISYKLTDSNGFSLTVWKCIAVTFSSSSFK